tara:strand:- start:164 stop:1102 length:939 start_codon:yes stop_codon:yes gene_type:complete
MAAVVKIKRSSVQDRVPTTSQIEAGELALNTRDGVLYSTDGSSVFQVGANTQNQNITNTLTVGGLSTFSSNVEFDSGGRLKITTSSGNPAIHIGGGGPNGIRFHDGSSFGTNTNAVDIKYRTGSNDLLVEQTTGNAKIAEFGGDDGHAALYFSNSKKLETTSSGVDITGDITVSNDITVTNDILPSSNNVSNIGSATKRFSELFLSGQTINLGGATLSSDGTGTLSISAAGAVLPAGSKVQVDDATQTELATLDAATGAVVGKKVSLFLAGDLNNAANTFQMKVNNDRRIFKAFTLSDGTPLVENDNTLFSF